MDAKTEAQIRAIGLRPEQLPAGTLINGKPIGEVVPDAKPTDRYKSKAERLMAWKLEQDQKDGLIRCWYYEPMSLVVIETPDERVHYRPDFLVVWPDGELLFLEVKGYCRDDARKTFLAAQARYPFWKFKMMRRTKVGWEQIK
jgi:hypothetical protein